MMTPTSRFAALVTGNASAPIVLHQPWQRCTNHRPRSGQMAFGTAAAS